MYASFFRANRDREDWTNPGQRLNYKVRVRGTKYLWGSAGITEDMPFPKPLHLHIHNDLFGEPIKFGTEKANGTQNAMGTLGAGEYVTIPLQDIRGVFASCSLESDVTCMIRSE